MGAQNSKISKEKLSEIVTKSVLKSTQNCSQNVEQTFKITAQDIGEDFILDGLDVNQVIDVDLSCLQTSQTSQDIKTNIETEIHQELNTSPFWNTVPYQQVYNKEVAKIVSDIQIDNIKTCLTSVSSETSIEIKEVEGKVLLKGITVKQVADIVTECIQNENNVVSNLTKLNDKLTQKTETHTTSIQNIIIFSAVSLIVIFILFGFRKKKVTS